MSKFIRKLPFNNRWSIAIKILPLVLAIIFVKYLTNYFGLDRIELNNLFTALISANIFLFGFLVSGVLSDYKEGEKLPGDLAATLESLADEGWITYQNTKSKVALQYLTKIDQLTQDILEWFNKIRKTDSIRDEIFELNSFFLQFEALTQINFISRLKQEQSQMRKMINRIHTIRETSFLGTGYAIAEIITTVIVGGMLFIKIGDSTYEAMIFTGFVSFVLIYMIFLIKDLDNPFSYYAEDNLSENVSLAPIEKVHARLDKMLKEIDRLT